MQTLERPKIRRRNFRRYNIPNNENRRVPRWRICVVIAVLVLIGKALTFGYAGALAAIGIAGVAAAMLLIYRVGHGLSETYPKTRRVLFIFWIAATFCLSISFIHSGAAFVAAGNKTNLARTEFLRSVGGAVLFLIILFYLALAKGSKKGIRS